MILVRHRMILVWLMFVVCVATSGSQAQEDVQLGAWTGLSLPQARAGHTCTWDPVGNRMIVFGGQSGESLLADTWGLEPSSNQGERPRWRPLITGGQHPTRRKGHSAIHDPVRNRLIVFGGSDGSLQGDVWTLSLATDEPSVWKSIAPAGYGPSSREGHSAVYDPVNDRMLIFGGNDGMDKGDLWELRLEPYPTWNRITPSGPAPGARSLHAAVTDILNQRMVMIGGSLVGAGMNDVWMFDFRIDQWSRLEPMGTPPSARFGHQAVFDAEEGRIVVVGGFDGFYRTDVWILEGNVWIAGRSTGSVLNGLFRSGAAFDPGSGRIFVFGGESEVAEFSDVHVLDLLGGSLVWWQSPMDAPRPRSRWGHSAIHDPTRDRMVIFGGFINANEPFTNDVWALSLATDEWLNLSQNISGELPPPRHSHSAVYDSKRHRMVVFGGVSGERLGDVWALPLGPGREWELLSPADAPPSPRHSHAAIYDPIRDRMLIQGGDDGEILGDLWTLDFTTGPSWRKRVLGGNFTENYLHGMTYDPDEDVAVVFGGSTSTGGGGSEPGSEYPPDATWAFTLGANPFITWTIWGKGVSNRFGHSMIHDATRSQVILHGGRESGFGLARNDTWLLREIKMTDGPWEYFTKDWSRVATRGNPAPAQSRHVAIYDPVRSRMILHGGNNAGAPTEAVLILGIERVPAVLQIAPGNLCVETGAQVSFSALGIWTDGSDKALVPSTASWSSSDPGVVAIDSSGTAIASLPGTVIIEANWSGVVDRTTLTVVSADVPPETMSYETTDMGFQGWSLPLIQEDDSVAGWLEASLGSPNPADWRLFRWNPRALRYVEVGSEDGIESIRPGDGFWLITKRAATIDLSGQPVPACEHAIDLQGGPGNIAAWNMIGNPFTAPVAVSEVRVGDGKAVALLTEAFNGMVEPVIKVWDAEDQVFRTATTMVPGLAYWVRKTSPGRVQLLIPRPDPAAAVPMSTSVELSNPIRTIRVPGEPEWVLSLRTHRGSERSAPLLLGAAAVPATGWNHLSRSLPPSPPGEFLRIFVPRPEWGGLQGNYIADFRPDASELVWEFTVQGSIEPGEIEIRLDAENLPSNRTLVLSSLDDNWVRHTRPGDRFTVANRTEQRFSLRVTDSPWVEDERAAPSTVRAFANPFTSAAGIMFTVTRNTEISVAIYDVSGRKIREIARLVDPGEHVITWDGMGQDGKPAGSGIYFARYRSIESEGVIRLVKLP